jgi:hypothetical protein
LITVSGNPFGYISYALGSADAGATIFLNDQSHTTSC